MELIQLSQSGAVAGEQFTQRRPEHSVIGLCRLGLIEEAEVLATTGPRLETGIKQFTEIEWPVIKGEASSCTVVAVEVALAVPHTHPVGDQCNQPTPKQMRQLHHPIVWQLRIDLLPIVAFDQMLHDLFQFLKLASGWASPRTPGEQLDLANAQKGRCQFAVIVAGLSTITSGSKPGIRRIPGATHGLSTHICVSEREVEHPGHA